MYPRTQEDGSVEREHKQAVGWTDAEPPEGLERHENGQQHVPADLDACDAAEGDRAPEDPRLVALGLRRRRAAGPGVEEPKGMVGGDNNSVT